MEIKIKISTAETTHLIDKAPLNHVLNMEIGGFLIAEKDSWEYLELMRQRKEKSKGNLMPYTLAPPFDKGCI